MYRPLELVAGRFVDAAGIYPDVLQAIAFRLFCTEFDLATARLVFPRTIIYVLEGNLFGIFTPYMR